MTTLKITSVPPGEAPDWVREQWVGLALQLEKGHERPFELSTGGVLTHPTTRLGWILARILGCVRNQTGYLVQSLPAIELLSKSSPGAANWWHLNVPEITVAGQYFVFDSDCGYVQSADAA